MENDILNKKNEKRNELFINEFEKWLKNKQLTDKTIRKHINNMDFYLNYYLTYYDIIKMEDGANGIYDFLDDFFIRKCMWSSENSIKDTASSIKKFYQCMSELNYVDSDTYKFVCNVIKDNMEIFLESYNDYMNGSYMWF